MHLLDESCGFVSALVKDNLAHQMRFSAKALEDELLISSYPHSYDS